MTLKELIELYGDHELSEDLARKIKEEIGIQSVWDIENGMRYFIVHHDGIINQYQWQGDMDDIEFRYMGNIFLTREEAEAEVERRKVETLLLMHGGRRELTDGEYNYMLQIDWSHGVDSATITPVKSQRQTQGAIYFLSEEYANEAVKAIGEQRVIDALFIVD